MADNYVGEIRLVGFNFAPVGWAFCDGVLLSISENDTLFNLIGTTYGGDGVNTFALPDLRGRVIVAQGGEHVIGQLGGVESVTLFTNEIPSHSHGWYVDNAVGTIASPQGHFVAAAPASMGNAFGSSAGANLNMPASTVNAAGSGLPHENRQPLLVGNYIIALGGIYPSQG